MNWRKHLILTSLTLTGSQIPKFFNKIKEMQYWSREKIEEYQNKKLTKLLLHAHKNITYYNKILTNCEVIKNQKVDLGNFNKIPLLTKKLIRNNFSDLKNDKSHGKSTYINHSGGSTGEPLEFIQDKLYQDWNYANKIFYKTEYGNKEIGEKEIRIWGSEDDICKDKKDWLKKIRNFIYNRTDLNAFRMSKNEMVAYIDKINELQPTWIEAYVQPVYEMAKFINENNLKVSSPKGVLTSAGTLFPEMKQQIENAFDCSVFNRYGSREVGDIACSCGKSSNLHISAWNNYVEILKSGKNNGKVIVTNLNNYTMPFIRYDIGDLAIISEDTACECRRKLPSLKTVEGREMSVFKKKDGGIVPAEFFIHFIGVVYNDGFIEKFQVIQSDYDYIKIKVVLNDKCKFDQNQGKIEQSIREVMGNNCKIKWEIVEKILPLKNGKYLYTICEI